VNAFRPAIACATLLLAALPAAAQYEVYFNLRDWAGAAFSETIARQREDARVREALTASYSAYETAYKRAGRDSAPVGPTSWRAESQSPWANAYGTPSATPFATASRPYPQSTVRLCTCYLPADARSWDGGPLSQADIVRRCTAQCN